MGARYKEKRELWGWVRYEEGRFLKSLSAVVQEHGITGELAVWAAVSELCPRASPEILGLWLDLGEYARWVNEKKGREAINAHTLKDRGHKVWYAKEYNEFLEPFWGSTGGTGSGPRAAGQDLSPGSRCIGWRLTGSGV